MVMLHTICLSSPKGGIPWTKGGHRACRKPCSHTRLKYRGIPVIRPNATSAESNKDSKVKSQAEIAVENGLELFRSGDAEGALKQFTRAQDLPTTREEELAAVYNSACAYAKLRKWQDAADAVVRSVNEFDLSLSVPLKDPDLAKLRDRKEWVAALEQMKGGISNKGFAKLRAEASSPFRLVRLFLTGGLSSGAALGSLVSSSKLLGALGGAGDLQEASKNFFINIACLGVLGFLFARELQAQKKGIETAAKEEELALLQVSPSPGSDMSVPLASFRGTYRPIIVAGSKGQVKKSLARAAGFKKDFIERGIVVVPVIINSEDVDEKLQQLRKEMKTESKGKGFSSEASTSLKDSSADTDKGEVEGKKWRLEAHDVDEWIKWIKTLGIDDKDAKTEVYAQIQLDGIVRSSGRGSPSWEKLISDIPELNSLQTRITDGRGQQRS